MTQATAAAAEGQELFVIRRRRAAHDPPGTSRWVYTGPGGWGALAEAAPYTPARLRRIKQHVLKAFGEEAVALEQAREEEGDGGTV